MTPTMVLILWILFLTIDLLFFCIGTDRMVNGDRWHEYGALRKWAILPGGGIYLFIKYRKRPNITRGDDLPPCHPDDGQP